MNVILQKYKILVFSDLNVIFRMTFEARNASAKCLQILYENRDTDDSTDFVIKSKDDKDGKEIKVHTFVLKSR